MIERLKGSKYESAEIIEDIVNSFDSRGKRVFRSEDEAMYLQFGLVSFRDPEFGIISGKLKVAGYVY